MSQYHPDRKALERFARGEVAGTPARKIEEHLRSGCGACQCLVDELLPGGNEGMGGGRMAGGRRLSAARTLPVLSLFDPPGPGEDDQAWDKVFAKVEQRLALISYELHSAPRLVDELLRHPEGRSTLIAEHRRFQTLAVCELLMDRSCDEGLDDPGFAVAIAELALEVVETLNIAYYGASVVQDLRARGWAYLANARRLNSDLTGAHQALELAEVLAEEGSSDPLEAARILEMWAALLSDQGCFEEAAECLDLAIEDYTRLGDHHRRGRALLSKGTFLGNAGWHEEAIALIPRGLALVDVEQEHRAVLSARQKLIRFLCESGRCTEALEHLELLREYHNLSPVPAMETNLLWLEGRVAAGLKRWQKAERCLLEVRRSLIARGLVYDAALTSLDLAALYLEQGRRKRVRQLAEEMLPSLLSQGIHRHVIAALVMFQQAVEGGASAPTLTRLAREVASYLLRARKNPHLSFRRTGARMARPSSCRVGYPASDAASGTSA